MNAGWNKSASAFASSSTAGTKDDLDDLFADEQPPAAADGGQRQQQDQQRRRQQPNRGFGGGAGGQVQQQPQSNQEPRAYMEKRRGQLCVNRVELLGTLVEDPVKRLTRAGSEFAMLKLATKKALDGKAIPGNLDSAEVHHLTTFGVRAQYVFKNLKKGSRVYACGRIFYDQRETVRIQSITTEFINAVVGSGEDKAAAMDDIF